MNRVEKLLSFPYYKKQFIYIVDDYNELQSKKGNLIQDTGDVIGKTISETIEDTFNPWRIAENWEKGEWWKLPLVGQVNLVTNAVESIQGKVNEKDLTKYEVWEKEDIKPIILDGNNNLEFQVGHPLKNIVYVAHPVMKGKYFPFANFHRQIFQHKWAEAVRMLYHLGATEIMVIHKTGWNRDFAANMNVDLPLDGVPVDFEVNYESKENSTNHIIGKLNLKNNNRAPELPDNLVWYYHEDAWKEIARGRLKFNLDEFTLEVNYKDDFNVNASLRTKVLEYGFGLGGNFEKHESTSWILKGKFNSIPPKNTN